MQRQELMDALNKLYAEDTEPGGAERNGEEWDRLYDQVDTEVRKIPHEEWQTFLWKELGVTFMSSGSLASGYSLRDMLEVMEWLDDQEWLTPGRP